MGADTGYTRHVSLMRVCTLCSIQLGSEPRYVLYPFKLGFSAVSSHVSASLHSGLSGIGEEAGRLFMHVSQDENRSAAHVWLASSPMVSPHSRTADTDGPSLQARSIVCSNMDMLCREDLDKGFAGCADSWFLLSQRPFPTKPVHAPF